MKMNVETQSTKEARYGETLAILEEKMNQSTNGYETISTILNTMVEVMQAEAGTLWYHDRFGRGFIVPRATCGSVLLDMPLLSLGEGVAGKVIDTGKAVIVPDCQNDSRWAGKVDAQTGFTTKSMICVPLMAKNAVFGCIQIINKTDDSVYDEEDLQLVSKLAQGISDLFVRGGLLNQQWIKLIESTKNPASAKKSQNEKGSSFREIFGSKDISTMEARLRNMEEFQSLNTLEQMGALSAAKKLWRYFGGKKK